MLQVIPNFTMSQDHANYTIKRLLRHLQRMCHYAGTDPRDLEDAKVRLAALAIVADAMVAEVIEMRNNSLIHGYPPEKSENDLGPITDPEFAETLMTRPWLRRGGDETRR
jgi:hypothetical protein